MISLLRLLLSSVYVFMCECPYIFDMIFYEFKVSVGGSAPPVGNLLWVVVCPKVRCFNRKAPNECGKWEVDFLHRIGIEYESKNIVNIHILTHVTFLSHFRRSIQSPQTYIGGLLKEVRRSV